jgi:energy-converting hydrogenase Eha subunit H
MLNRLLSIIVGAVMFVGAAPVAQSTGTYSIDFYAITSGGNTLHGKCFFVTGSVGQVAPGYSSHGIYALYAGYQFPVAAESTSDEIFFNSFEGCGQ